MPEKWETYEEVAAYLLSHFAREFGVEFFEGKQNVTGKLTRTTWEIDAKGIKNSDSGFLVVECKRWAKGIPQSVVGNLAFAIIDSGASEGVPVVVEM